MSSGWLELSEAGHPRRIGFGPITRYGATSEMSAPRRYVPHLTTGRQRRVRQAPLLAAAASAGAVLVRTCVSGSGMSGPLKLGGAPAWASSRIVAKPAASAFWCSTCSLDRHPDKSGATSVHRRRTGRLLICRREWMRYGKPSDEDDLNSAESRRTAKPAENSSRGV